MSLSHTIFLIYLIAPCVMCFTTCKPFSLSPSPAASARRAVSMNAHGGEDRHTLLPRKDLLKLAAAGLAGVAFQRPAFAKYGEYANIEMSPGGGNSMSSLGANDIPAAGKIDPYDDREKANAEYAVRMQKSERIDENREKSNAKKEEIFAKLYECVDKKEWKKGLDFLNRELFELRKTMNVVSTKGARAVSAAQRGGQPEKALTKVELAEKTFLATMNKLAVTLNGEKKPTNYDTCRLLLKKAQDDWYAWIQLASQ